VQLSTIPDQRKDVAADPSTGWLDHRQCDGSGERCIERIATALQHGEASLHSERLAGGHGPVRREDRLMVGGKNEGVEVELHAIHFFSDSPCRGPSALDRKPCHVEAARACEADCYSQYATVVSGQGADICLGEAALIRACMFPEDIDPTVDPT